MATRKRPARKRVPGSRIPEGSAPEPVDDSLGALRDAAHGCKRCPLWKPATQTVFGEGPANARILVVGEQPGDQEDLSGHPFVGPAGKLFDRALEELGVDRNSACQVPRSSPCSSTRDRESLKARANRSHAPHAAMVVALAGVCFERAMDGARPRVPAGRAVHAAKHTPARAATRPEANRAKPRHSQ